MVALAGKVPWLFGGDADLGGSTKTIVPGGDFGPSGEGRNLRFGVREHAMGAICNGLAYHGAVRPFAATFFVFSDYMRPPVRLAALSSLKVIYSWTHDSVGVGEDGPTHQPIEQLASLRAMPDLRVVRPADANEVAIAWKDALAHEGPTALVLSRQNVPVLEGTAGNEGVSRGAYVLAEAGTDDGAHPDIVLVGTGTEVSVCMEAGELLAAEGIAVRVVSMPCWEDFDGQDEAYQAEVLPAEVPTLAVEAATSFGWDRWADDTVAIDRFGASAPGDVVMRELGINPEHVAARAHDLLEAID
jgi:transketolase